MAPSTSKPQYQHYIPRFILRKFLQEQGQPKTSKQRSKELRKAFKKGIEIELVNVYDLTTKTLQSRSIAKSFGEINLYTDITNGINSQHVEEKLSRLENEAAQAIKIIQDSAGKGTFTLTRSTLGTLRKFVFIMHNRKPNIQASYCDIKSNNCMTDWVLQYMKTHNLKTPEEMWLYGLSYLLDNPHVAIVAEGERIYAQYGMSRIAQMLATKVDPNLGNWFAVDYTSLASSHYFGVWEAASGSEFVVGNNSFGLWEGKIAGSPNIHRLFVISPKLVFVLRNNALRQIPKGAIDKMIMSSLVDIPTPPPDVEYHAATSFASEEALQAYRKTKAAEQDIFTYRITKLTEEQTREVNEVILLNIPQDGSLVFSSKEHMSKAVRYHITSPDIVVQFENPYGRYSALLFSLDHTSTTTVEESDSDFRLRVVLKVLRLRLIRFRSEWDESYWCYRAMTADPNQTHPLAAQTRLRIAQAKGFFGNKPNNKVDPQRNPTARLSDSLSEKDSNCVLGRMSRVLVTTLRYDITKSRTDAAFVKESLMVGLVEWMVREKPSFIKEIIGSDTYARLTRT